MFDTYHVNANPFNKEIDGSNLVLSAKQRN
jgi:hypothetical protein